MQSSADSLGHSRATTSHSHGPFRDAPAPAPTVPRHRSKSVGRPNTAPTAQFAPSSSPRPKSAGKNGISRSPSRKPFIVQKTRPGPPYLVGVSGADDDDDELPPVPPIAAHFQASAPSSPVTSKGPGSVNGSIMSGSAQSAGGKSGYVDILDAQGALRPSDFKSRLRATGARDYGEDVAERNMGVNGVDLNSPPVAAFYALTGGGPLAYKSDGSAVDVHGNKYAADAVPASLTSEVQGEDADQPSAVANQRLRGPVFPARTTSLLPNARYREDTATGTHDNSSEDVKAVRRLSLQSAPQGTASHTQAKSRPTSLHPALPSANLNGRPTSSFGLVTSLNKPSRPRDANFAASNDGEQEQGNRRRSRSAPNRPSSSGTDASSRARTYNKPLPQPPGANPLPRSTNAPSHPRNRSTGSSSVRNKSTALGDISEHVQPPPKINYEAYGTRNDSVSSWTPSTVASSNNRSRHTADTSLDLGYVLPRKANNKAPGSHVRLQSDSTVASDKSESTCLSQRAGKPARLTQPQSPDDVYMSTTTDGSDAEPHVGIQRKRHQDGEHLLFNEDGYGNGLPGLFNATVEDASPPAWATFRKSHQAPPASAPRKQPPSLKWRHEEDDDYSTVSESEKQPAQPAAAGGILSPVFDPVEAAMDARLDAKLAVQLRKKAKRRERMSTSSTLAARKSRMDGQKHAVKGDYEQGHVADSEV
ncbi:uncharacterized protein J7T54_007875 [Emericellopsis cladophorae]|uniref:Uncharacterized protein n=1 Tax=Emericellopsis cladophorae TaxID=2686198 RepID=A0A9P9Y772_9HYPO|nr:uncharacterized protein J7T54_007875 [Emericellopsis cladophorae]KAI6784782.1 hypothetical protein J7T54_007875 [Emericellopsis cladophorae]